MVSPSAVNPSMFTPKFSIHFKQTLMFSNCKNTDTTVKNSSYIYARRMSMLFLETRHRCSYGWLVSGKRGTASDGKIKRSCTKHTLRNKTAFCHLTLVRKQTDIRRSPRPVRSEILQILKAIRAVFWYD